MNFCLKNQLFFQSFLKIFSPCVPRRKKQALYLLFLYIPSTLNAFPPLQR